jgi:hypothetical protein
MSELKKQSAGSEAKLAEALKMIEEAKQEALLKLEEEAKQRAADRAIMENGDGIKDSGGED